MRGTMLTLAQFCCFKCGVVVAILFDRINVWVWNGDVTLNTTTGWRHWQLTWQQLLFLVPGIGGSDAVIGVVVAEMQHNSNFKKIQWAKEKHENLWFDYLIQWMITLLKMSHLLLPFLLLVFAYIAMAGRSDTFPFAPIKFGPHLQTSHGRFWYYLWKGNNI